MVNEFAGKIMPVNFKFALVTLMFALVGTALALAEPQSQVVEFPAVPPPAQAMLAESGDGNGKLGEIERVQEDGEIWYDATLRKGRWSVRSVWRRMASC